MVDKIKKFKSITRVKKMLLSLTVMLTGLHLTAINAFADARAEAATKMQTEGKNTLNAVTTVGQFLIPIVMVLAIVLLSAKSSLFADEHEHSKNSKLIKKILIFGLLGTFASVIVTLVTNSTGE